MLMETAHGAIERKMLSSLAQSLRARRAKTCATERSGSQVQIMVWFLLTLVANRHQIKTHSDLKDGVIPSRCFELKTCLLIFVISLIYCMILPTCVMLPSQPHAHTHMGLVNKSPNPEKPDPEGASRAWAPSSWHQEATSLITG